MDDNMNPNMPGSNSGVGSDAGQGQAPNTTVPPQQPEPAQPQVPPSGPTVPPQQPVTDVPGQTTPTPTVGT